MSLLLLTALSAALILAAPVLLPTTIRGWSLLLLGVTCLSVSWNAVRIGGFQPSDYLLVAAFLLAAAQAKAHRGLPRLLWLGAGLIAFAGLLSQVLPPGPKYANDRFVGRDLASTTGGTENVGSNLSQLTKFEIALVLVPLTILLLQPTRREIRRLADLWVLSAAVSSGVAISDHLGVTHIGATLNGFADISGREVGLTVQPNHLAVAAALAIPLAMTWLRARRWPFGLIVLVILGAGVVLSGSRGGLIVAAFAATAALVRLTHLRGARFVAAIGMPLVLAVFSEKISGWVSRTLADRQGVAVSDSQRALRRGQGRLDFLHSPFHGIGFDQINAAHEVHLQLLAAGGLLALVGAFIYGVGVARKAGAAVQADRMYGQALVVTLTAWCVLHFLENQISDRYLFVPVGLLIALSYLRSSSPASPRTGYASGTQPATAASSPQCPSR